MAVGSRITQLFSAAWLQGVFHIFTIQQAIAMESACSSKTPSLRLGKTVSQLFFRNLSFRDLHHMFDDVSRPSHRAQPPPCCQITPAYRTAMGRRCFHGIVYHPS